MFWYFKKRGLQSAYMKGNNIFASEFLTFIRANIYTKNQQKLAFWKIKKIGNYSKV